MLALGESLACASFCTLSTPKGDSYCARSAGIKAGLSKEKQNDPNTPNNLSRKKWACVGKKSRR